MAESAPSVLIVDDERMTVNLLADLCLDIGFKPLHKAYDVKTALEIFEAEQPDVVFADLRMEPIDGLEFTLLLRDQNRSINPMVPIVMVTAYSERDKMIEARDAGVTEILVKPFTGKSVIRQLRSIIDYPRAFVLNDTYFGPDRRRADKLFEGSDRRDPANQAVESPTLKLVDPTSRFARELRRRAGS